MKFTVTLTLILILSGIAMAQKAKIIQEIRHYGMCDASAAVALSPDIFAVANDEDNFLKVYRNNTSGSYLAGLDISTYLQDDIPLKEADLEGASEIDGIVFWITSHGRNKKGKRQESRYHFFANQFRIENGNYTHRQVDSAYSKLLDDMFSDPRLSKYNLEEATKLPPKDRGGLNIEGLSVTPDKQLLIGFRNPIPDGNALLVPLENPFEIIRGKKAALGDPIELPLGNLGIRSIEYWPARGFYLIMGGPYDSDSGENFMLFKWSGDTREKPERYEGLDLKTLNIESIIIYPDKNDRVQLLSDDGGVKRGKRDCKDLKDGDDEKYFRSIWVAL